MTPDDLEVTACDFVAEVYPSIAVIRASTATLRPAPPYAVVSLVSDVQDRPTDTIGSSSLAYTAQRQARIQVSVVGDGARGICQRLALAWRSDVAASQAAATAGLAPSTAGDVVALSIPGSSDVIRSASVDLRGYHRETYDPATKAPAEVSEVDIALTGLSDGGSQEIEAEYVIP